MNATKPTARVNISNIPWAAYIIPPRAINDLYQQLKLLDSKDKKKHDKKAQQAADQALQQQRD